MNDSDKNDIIGLISKVIGFIVALAVGYFLYNTMDGKFLISRKRPWRG
jgi:hypothetical protein